MNKIQLLDRFGFDFNSDDQTIGFLCLKSSIHEVSPILAEELGGVAKIDCYGKPYPLFGWMLSVFQYQGHQWTICFSRFFEEAFVQDLSKKLQTQVIYFMYEDTSAWQGYVFYDQGQEQEAYYYGLDYQEEFECYGIEVDLTSWNAWDLNVRDEDGEQYQFRSKIRQVEAQDIQNSQTFIDHFFQSQQLWLPNWEYLPCQPEIVRASALTANDFVRVDLICQETL